MEAVADDPRPERLLRRWRGENRYWAHNRDAVGIQIWHGTLACVGQRRGPEKTKRLTFHTLTEFLREVRIGSVSSTTRTDSVWFSTKGQVVIPAWLRKQFHIEDGTRVVVQATTEGILLKPVTAPLIQRGRGIIQRRKGSKPLADEWAEHRKLERELEERHAR